MSQPGGAPLIGTWITSPNDRRSLDRVGRVTLQFTPRGALVHSTWRDGREIVRFLRYRTEANAIVTTDGDPPFEERRPYALTPQGELYITEDNGDSASYVEGDPWRSFEASGLVLDLALFGLEFGFDRLRESRTLEPYVITESAGERSFLALDGVGDDRVEAVARARRTFGCTPERVDASVIVFDGLLRVDKRRVDAVFVEAYEKHRELGIVLAQRYRGRKLLTPARRRGSVAYCGRAMSTPVSRRGGEPSRWPS